MRADRLLAAVLHLQRKGRVTAAELAEELEVSERTARRDLEALSMAGVPVYPMRGRGGGWELVGGYRTDLSGLTTHEARALFLVAGPSASGTPEVRAALRKLIRALPEPLRADAEAASSAVMVDAAAWGGAKQEAPPFLEALQHAVVARRRIELGYASQDKSSTRTVDPYGLVAKREVWYLLGGTEAGLRTFRVERVTAVELRDDLVVLPRGFDLATAWETVLGRVEELRSGAVGVTLEADAEALPHVLRRFGPKARIVSPPVAGGRTTVEIGFDSEFQAIVDLAAYPENLEVIGPPSVRGRLAELGAALARVYATP